MNMGYCSVCGRVHDLDSTGGCCLSTPPPASAPFRCPVCNGTGYVSTPPGVAGDIPTVSYGSTGPFFCRACGGVGIVWSKV
jgi:hypothetical protein